eukprot:GILJ01009418.1.p1 GENE.GILJ01009418.1~~GILJ01009418.1.p1  ORF type:complete len:951 (-),score=125.96 GILJ01009418.1:169-3021(-)
MERFRSTVSAASVKQFDWTKPPGITDAQLLPVVAERLEVVITSATNVTDFSLRNSLKRSQGSPYTVYTVHCQYGGVSWVVVRRFKEFYDLYKQLASRSEIDVHSLPSPPEKTWFRSVKASLVSKRVAQLSKFMQALVSISSVRQCAAVAEFLEVSYYSFVKELGMKAKEGYVYKKSKRLLLGGSWKRRWFVLKENFICWFRDPCDHTPKGVFLFDSTMVVARSRRKRFTVHSSNQNVTLELKAESYRYAEEWPQAIAALASRSTYVTVTNQNYGSFGSFAPVRFGCTAMPLVDGKDTLQRIAQSMQGARSQIFIAGWWITPNLAMIRDGNGRVTLDELLYNAACRGVQIFVLLFKEIPLALPLDSLYTKTALMKLHPNIHVIRHPGANVVYWSHHEKLIVVDQQVAYVGGIDLALGRFDDSDHALTDTTASIWKGKDYYNPRIQDLKDVNDPWTDLIDRRIKSRMPWHDVHVELRGEAVRDLARHFVQRWNHDKADKGESEQVLLLPHTVSSQHVSNVPSFPQWPLTTSVASQYISPPAASMVHTRTTMIQHHSHPYIPSPVYHGPLPPLPVAGAASVPANQMSFIPIPAMSSSHVNQGQFNSTSVSSVESSTNTPSCYCQVVRSMGSWSGIKTESSVQNAYIAAIESAQYFIYIENQFFISCAGSGDGEISNKVAMAIVNRIRRAISERRPFKTVVVLPCWPEGNFLVNPSLRMVLHYQYRTISRSKYSILQRLQREFPSIELDQYISFFCLRKHAVLNNQPVWDQIYVHSKLMIVDDRTIILGSANINERSMNGERDTELAVVIQDANMVPSSMAGQPFAVGAVAQRLRIKLWEEHLGLEPTSDSEHSIIADPICEEVYSRLWTATAVANTEILQSVFPQMPRDDVRRISEYNDLPPLSPDSPQTLLNKLEKVTGHLTVFPLDFLLDEELAHIPLSSAESLLPRSVFQ